MGRRIDLRGDRDPILAGDPHKFLDLLLGIGTIGCGQAGKSRTVQTKGRVLMLPVGLTAGIHGVVIKVQLEIIKLIPGHQPHIVLQKRKGHKLAANVEHKAALLVLRIIARIAFRQASLVGGCVQNLQDGARTIESSGWRAGVDGHGGVDIEQIALVADATIRGSEREEEVARTGIALYHNRRVQIRLSEQVLAKDLHRDLELIGEGGIENDLCLRSQGQIPGAAVPVAQDRHHRGGLVREESGWREQMEGNQAEQREDHAGHDDCQPDNSSVLHACNSFS